MQKNNNGSNRLARINEELKILLPFHSKKIENIVYLLEEVR